jgi:hypothetical protein
MAGTLSLDLPLPFSSAVMCKFLAVLPISALRNDGFDFPMVQDFRCARFKKLRSRRDVGRRQQPCLSPVSYSGRQLRYLFTSHGGRPLYRPDARAALQSRGSTRFPWNTATARAITSNTCSARLRPRAGTGMANPPFARWLDYECCAALDQRPSQGRKDLQQVVKTKKTELLFWRCSCGCASPAEARPSLPHRIGKNNNMGVISSAGDAPNIGDRDYWSPAIAASHFARWAIILFPCSLPNGSLES